MTCESGMKEWLFHSCGCKCCKLWTCRKVVLSCKKEKNSRQEENISAFSSAVISERSGQRSSYTAAHSVGSKWMCSISYDILKILVFISCYFRNLVKCTTCRHLYAVFAVVAGYSVMEVPEPIPAIIVQEYTPIPECIPARWWLGWAPAPLWPCTEITQNDWMITHQQEDWNHWHLYLFIFNFCNFLFIIIIYYYHYYHSCYLW